MESTAWNKWFHVISDPYHIERRGDKGLFMCVFICMMSADLCEECLVVWGDFICVYVFVWGLFSCIWGVLICMRNICVRRYCVYVFHGDCLFVCEGTVVCLCVFICMRSAYLYEEWLFICCVYLYEQHSLYDFKNRDVCGWMASHWLQITCPSLQLVWIPRDLEFYILWNYLAC